MKNEILINANTKKNRIKNGVAWGLVIVTLVLLLIVTIMQLKLSKWQGTNIVVPMLSTIASITGLSAVWEFFAKYNFAKQMVELVGISTNISESGIFECISDFKAIKWRQELEGTKNLRIVVTHATTWRNQNREVLQDFITNGGKIFVSLPNSKNKDLMAEYDRRYEYDKGTTKRKVEEAVNDFTKIGAIVSVYDKSIQTSYYYMDQHAIMVPFNHLKAKGFVPAIKAISNGDLYKFVQNDIRSIFNMEEKSDEK